MSQTSSTQTLGAIASGSGGKTLALGFQMLANLVAILYVIITDSGGSTKSWRDHGAPGDLRKLVASLLTDEVLAAALELRKKDGPFPNHPMGNQFLYAVAESCGGDLDAAMEVINRVLPLLMPVYPISNRVSKDVGYPHLQGVWANKSTFTEEEHIDNPGDNAPYRIVDATLSSPVYVNPRLADSLISGEMITLVIGPGSLYGSTVAALLTSGLKEAIDEAPNVRVIYVCNLATRPGETIGMSVSDHFEVVNSYLGRHKVDYGIVSHHRLSEAMVRQYADKGQELLNPTDEELAKLPCKVRQGDFLLPNASGEARHDPGHLAVEIRRIHSREC